MSFFTRFVLASALSTMCGIVLADNVASGSAQSGSLATPSITNVDAAKQADATPTATEKAAAAAALSHGQPPPTVEASEFQKFIFESIGKALPMYGYSMFDNLPSTFAPVDHVPVTPDYVVGPGDEIMVRAWGQVDINYKATVDRLGAIFVPQVGSINVAGLQFKELNGYIKTAIGRNFRNFDLEVNLGQLRSIQIYVVGQAKRPGSYTVSSLSTLVNAMFASGGPSYKGSMRHIQLKRNDEIVTEFDLYDFLLDGDKSKDVKLQPGDVIYYSPIGAEVAISGSVNNPAVYELKDKADLANLIKMAGGLTTTAAGQRVEVDRIDDHKDRMVEDFDLDQKGLASQMRDGDLVQVLSISPKLENAVTLRGNVAYPFRYSWSQGMRITDLIPNKDVLVTKDYWLKTNAMNLAKVTGLGEINHPILGINWDYAAIERFDWKNLRSDLIPFNLGKAVLDHDPSQNLELQPGDVVTVFSLSDMQVPEQKQARLVTVEGEVDNAGVYQAKPGETLRQLVARIGGITPDAYLFGAEFTRESTKKLQQQRLNQAVDRMEQDLRKNAATAAQAAMDKQSQETAKIQAESQQTALEKLRQVQATGRIVLEIPPGKVSLADIPDIALENGDRLYIPPIPSTVGVYGDVYNENNSFFYKDNKRVEDYLAQAGGPTRDADTGRIFVLRADGSVISSQSDRGLFSASFSRMHLMPGDSVVVPEQRDKTPFIKSAMDWTTMLMNLGVSFATLKFIGVI